MPVFKAHDGRDLFFQIDGDGPPVLLVHGWAVHGDYFDELASGLAADHMVIRPDLRGHHRSMQPGDQPQMQDFGQDLAALLAHLDVCGVTAVGWSMGAMVCWEYLTQGGDRFSALIIEDMVPKILNTPDWSHGLRNNFGETENEMVLRFVRTDWERYQELIARGMFAVDEAGDGLTDARRAWLDARSWAVDQEALTSAWDSMSRADYRELLREIQIPVAVACGAKSAVYDRAAAEWMCEQLPDGRMQLFEASGHALHLEEPWRFEAMIRHLVSETTS